ncbi:MAG: dockerin type I domain-containing protein [Bryobacteraceae bacterium]
MAPAHARSCGDLNVDGVVNALDHNLLRAALGKAVSAVERRNDLDGDGEITYNDYRAWAACYVRSTANP